jgi:hypothetical protein
LGDETVGQLRSGDPLGKARVVVDLVADRGLATEGTGLDDDGIDALAGGIDGGRQTGRPSADYDQIVGSSFGRGMEADAPGQDLVARVHVVRAVGVHNRRDDLAAVLQGLKPIDRAWLLVDVDVVVSDSVCGQELLDPFAVWAPPGADNRDA